ncbi:MAG TPA: hypothetical protein VNN21_09120, partial [Dehalococcoidia bacterium]|nr:hypothetical protein [Dehalococcoidia bacterium]
MNPAASPRRGAAAARCRPHPAVNLSAVAGVPSFGGAAIVGLAPACTEAVPGRQEGPPPMSTWKFAPILIALSGLAILAGQ